MSCARSCRKHIKPLLSEFEWENDMGMILLVVLIVLLLGGGGGYYGYSRYGGAGIGGALGLVLVILVVLWLLGGVHIPR